jgi:hypothetical protein
MRDTWTSNSCCTATESTRLDKSFDASIRVTCGRCLKQLPIYCQGKLFIVQRTAPLENCQSHDDLAAFEFGNGTRLLSLSGSTTRLLHYITGCGLPPKNHASEPSCYL